MSIENIEPGHAFSDLKNISANDEYSFGAVAPIGGLTKRSFDTVFSLLAILTFSTVLVGIAILLKLRSEGPVFFVQQRVGANGRMFPCLKFRTMVRDADWHLSQLLENDPEARKEFRATQKLRHDPRIIPVIGSFLRKTSLDELPQFFNVLMGHMSVVGPRPVTYEEWITRYGRDHEYREARPGITGLWQTSGRNEVSFQERVRMDADYVKSWSIWQDIILVLRTVSVVCKERNGY